MGVLTNDKELQKLFDVTGSELTSFVMRIPRQ